MFWQTSRRMLSLETPLLMAILNVTPDSFSDGGRFASVDAAIDRAKEMIDEGADIIDIGGESTRPGSERVSDEVEIDRVVPVIAAITSCFDIPVSIDTSKSEVAKAAVNAGAEIINDISGLRFDERIAEVAAAHNTGLVLMHSRGRFETMHSQPPVDDIFAVVSEDFDRAIIIAAKHGVQPANIALDIGIGFGKTLEQNLELIAKLDRLVHEYSSCPVLVGTSRKSFIGKILGDKPANERLTGSLASAAIAVWNGAKIVRVHDVKDTVEMVKMIGAIKANA
ncbi:MAG TPA: dihydropteroate synthase [Pyrinomonadaceae bacterium]|nr:dihydropteroate synthase [Pyrinomonadaceae bacterium]